MKIYKDTYPGFESQSAIESEIQKAIEEIYYRNTVGNKPYTHKPWAKEIIDKEWEFIDKTIEEARQDEADESKLDAEIKEENARAAIFTQAASDPLVRDQVIFSEMNKAGFTLEKVSLAKVSEDWDGKDMTKFRDDRAAAKQKIIDEIESAV